MHKIVLIIIGAVFIICTSTASAVTLQNHVVLPHGVTTKSDRHQVVVTTVAPSDRDDDGYADSVDNCPDDHYMGNGGCTPPPPKPVVTTSVSQITTTTYTPPVTTSSGGCPSYMSGEASSPTDVNSSSGAAGCFQILPSTQANYGCSDVGADCAARICADVGNTAWNASGSTPCDYLGVEP